MSKHIVMLAGENSGDKLGAEVLRGLAVSGLEYEASGVGGDSMITTGFRSIFPLADFTAHGFLEGLRSYGRLRRRADDLIDYIREVKPDLVLTIDNKYFSLRLGRMLKEKMRKEGWSVPLAHLVAPTVWAWGGWRARKIGRSVDYLLCLFPFEVDYFIPHGVNAIPVGHPSLSTSRPERNTARASLEIKQKDLVLVLLPGSRLNEILRLLPTMIEAAKILRDKHDGLRVLLPASDSVAPQIKDIVASNDFIEILPQSKLDFVLAAGDFAFICSGTITLETALHGLAGHVYYKTDWLTTILGHLLMDKSKIVLANAVSGNDIYDLSLNKAVTAENMINIASNYFSEADTKGASRKAMQHSLIQALHTSHKNTSEGQTTTDDFASNTASVLKNILNDH